LFEAIEPPGCFTLRGWSLESLDGFDNRGLHVQGLLLLGCGRRLILDHFTFRQNRFRVSTQVSTHLTNVDGCIPQGVMPPYASLAYSRDQIVSKNQRSIGPCIANRISADASHSLERNDFFLTNSEVDDESPWRVRPEAHRSF
jgi:hypothetical protein